MKSTTQSAKSQTLLPAKHIRMPAEISAAMTNQTSKGKKHYKARKIYIGKAEASLMRVLVTTLSIVGMTLTANAAPRGYSIPTIDLAGETNRQVIVDREPGQYLGHPTTV